MMYKNREHAMRALAEFIKSKKMPYLRIDLVGNEERTPAELWMLQNLAYWRDHVKRSTRIREDCRRLIGIARSLDLYPIPQWYEVRQRFLNARGNNGERK